MKKILITDSLFIGKKEEEILQNAGFALERLDTPKATEEELIAALPGKSGYILGGTEQVTENVLDAADMLEVISFTGIGYKGFIPAWEDATKKGIAITNAPDGATHAVAEWAITAALAMNRDIFALGQSGTKVFETTRGIENQHVGIIGFGRIGQEIAKILSVFRPASMNYYSKHQHSKAASENSIKYFDMDSLLQKNDIVFLCVSDDAGKDFINTRELALLRDGSLIVNITHPGIINAKALQEELLAQRIRGASDHVVGEGFEKISSDIWYGSKGSNAFNTHSAIALTNTMTTQSILNVLSKGDDQYIVNPDFRKYKK